CGCIWMPPTARGMTEDLAVAVRITSKEEIGHEGVAAGHRRCDGARDHSGKRSGAGVRRTGELLERLRLRRRRAHRVRPPEPHHIERAAGEHVPDRQLRLLLPGLRRW